MVEHCDFKKCGTDHLVKDNDIAQVFTSDERYFSLALSSKKPLILSFKFILIFFPQKKCAMFHKIVGIHV